MKQKIHPLVMATPLALSAAITQAEPLSTESIRIAANGTQLPMQGLSQFFTGDVRVEPLFQAQGEEKAGGATVTFEPGARTNWHTHPIGQVLIVTYGSGWVQQWGSTRNPIKTGDVVHIPANVKHWHGATDATPMMHIAIQESKEGEVVTWMEPVSDTQYQHESGQTQSE